jgi:hypothetical protein
VLANHDGAVDSYGIELQVTNLARTLRKTSATITVQASNENALTFKAKRARGRCLAEGTVYWDGPDDKGLAAADPGDRPFAYKVELILDSVRRYVSGATWPDDGISGNEPSVSLVAFFVVSVSASRAWRFRNHADRLVEADGLRIHTHALSDLARSSCRPPYTGSISAKKSAAAPAVAPTSTT